MRKVVLQEFVTLDGLVTGPNGSVDFIPASTRNDAKFGGEQVALMEAVDTLILGRVTYAMLAASWPSVTEGAEQGFVERFNALSKVVFSRTLDRAPWGRSSEGRIVRTSPVEKVARMRREPGKSILISGSISVAQSLIDENLIDEYRLILCPVVLGNGRRLFRNDFGSITMTLVGARTLDRGGVSLIFNPRDPTA